MDTFLAITSFTWLVTFLGFGLVLCILFFFVYIIKFIGMIMNLKSNKTENGKIVESPVTTSVTSTSNVDDRVNAAIALTLHLYFNSLHDVEPTQVTIVNQPTQWNGKLFGMNNLHR